MAKKDGENASQDDAPAEKAEKKSIENFLRRWKPDQHGTPTAEQSGGVRVSGAPE